MNERNTKIGMTDFNKFYKNNFDTQVNVMYRHTKDRDVAQDIVQQSYVKALKYQSSYDPSRSKISTWFNMIMFNTLRNYKKGDMTAQTMDVDDGGNLVEQLPETISFERIQENFDLISGEINLVKADSSRQILRLFYLTGYQSDEICGALDISQSKVTSCCSRFKLKLLDKYGLEI